MKSRSEPLNTSESQDSSKTENATIELLKNRRSVRDFETRPIPEAIVRTLLETTLRAPTAGNMMLYSILRIEDESIKKRLAVSCDDQPFIARSPLVLVFLADYAKWMRYFDLCGVRDLEAGRKGDLNAVRPAAGDMFLAIDDALIAAQTAVTAAEALGLGSCYIGDVMERFEEHRELLGFPRWCFPAAMLCIGYPSARQRAAPLRSRFPMDTMVFTDRYRELESGDYERMFGTDEYRNMPLRPGAKNYGQHMYLRKFAAEFSVEMRRSVDAALDDWRSSSR
ncbi:MAG: nitroreductase family protein [Rectinemataceae bacterium]